MTDSREKEQTKNKNIYDIKRTNMVQIFAELHFIRSYDTFQFLIKINMIMNEKCDDNGQGQSEAIKKESISCEREISKFINDNRELQRGERVISQEPIQSPLQQENSGSLKRKSEVLYYKPEVKRGNFEFEANIFFSVKTDQVKSKSNRTILEFEQPSTLNFFQNFLKFYDWAVDIKSEQIRFKYMQELFNLGLNNFPSDEEILKIQKSICSCAQASNQKIKKNWGEEDKKILIWTIGKLSGKKNLDFRAISQNDWNCISSIINRRDGFQCKQKWLHMLKMPLQQAPWTYQEDEMLKRLIAKFEDENRANKWSAIATELNMQLQINIHRNGKQCRERWNNYLNPYINRLPWKVAEDIDLLKLSFLLGKRWALISKKLKVQRSENSVKNRFHCLLKKESDLVNKQEGVSVGEQPSSQYDDDGNQIEDQDLTACEIQIITNIISKLEWRQKEEKDDQIQIKEEVQIKIEPIQDYSPMKFLQFLTHYPALRRTRRFQQEFYYLLFLILDRNQLNQYGIRGFPSQLHTFIQDMVDTMTVDEVKNCVPALVNPYRQSIMFLQAEEMREALSLQQNNTDMMRRYQEQYQQEVQASSKFGFLQNQNRPPLITSLGAFEDQSNQPVIFQLGSSENNQNIILPQSQQKIKQEENEEQTKQQTNLIQEPIKQSEKLTPNTNICKVEELIATTQPQVIKDQNPIQYQSSFQQQSQDIQNFPSFTGINKPSGFQQNLFYETNQRIPGNSTKTDQCMDNLGSMTLDKANMAPRIRSQRIMQKKFLEISKSQNLWE